MEQAAEGDPVVGIRVYESVKTAACFLNCRALCARSIYS